MGRHLGFATIDFETTGMSPERGARAIEIAVVHSDPDGTVTGRWDTLINPYGDVGRSDIHRILPEDVRGAPGFAEIADKLIELLSGRVIVAHNAAFDLRFLQAELDEAGYGRRPPLASLCTMRTARDFVTGRRTLAACCAAMGVALEDAHRASADALATAELLAAFIRRSPAGRWDALLSSAPRLTPGNRRRAVWMPRESAAEPIATGAVPETMRGIR